MTIRLVSYTKPVIEGVNAPVELIAYCARVSNPENQFNTETAGRLLRYLIKHKHFSPLEMVDATIEIEAPRDISRQVLRHRSFVFQEWSQRYSEALGFADPRECRMQDPTNRQSSLPCLDEVLTAEWEQRQRAVVALASASYQWALDRGIAKEVARVILPEGLTLSRLYMKGSLRSWIHYIDLRGDMATQAEHRAIAVIVASIITELFGLPDLLKAA